MINKYLTEMHLHTKETSNCGKMPAAETAARPAATKCRNGCARNVKE